MARRRTPWNARATTRRAARTETGASLYRDLDTDLASALLSALGTEARRPVLLGKKPTGAGRLRLSGLSQEAITSLSQAGFSKASTLNEFSLHKVGGGASQIGLRDLDRIQRAQIKALYGDRLKPKLVDWLSDQHVYPWHAVGFFKKCGLQLEPFPWQPATIDFDSFKRPRDFSELIPYDWKHLFHLPGEGWTDPLPSDSWKKPGYGTVDPSTFANTADVLGHHELVRMAVDTDRAVQLMGTPVGSGIVGEALALAQGLVAHGEVELGLQLAQHVGGTRTSTLTELERYQVQAVAPAVVTVALGTTSPLAFQSSAAALRSAVPGTSAATVALRGAVAAARFRADDALLAAAHASGPEERLARDIATQEYLGVLTGTPLERAKREAALPLDSATALLDLYRAVGVAATTGFEATKWKNPADPTFHGRTLPDDAPAWLMGGGGLSSTIDPLVKGHVLHAWRQLHHLHFPGRYVPSVLPGDLFRFDWLLGEARSLADDVARIEQLLASFLNMVLEQALTKIDEISGVTDELARLVDQLVKKVKAIADAVPPLITDLVTTARSAVVLIGLLRALAAWPHSNWIAVFTALGTAFATGADPVAAVIATINGFLTPTITAILSGIAADLTTTIAGLDATVKAAQLPQTLRDAFAAAAAAAGVPNPGQQIIQPLVDALNGLDLPTIAAPIIAGLTTAVTIPPWITALLTAYVVGPILAVIGVSVLAGPFSASVIDTILALGTEYLISLVLLALGDAFGLAADLMRKVTRLTGDLTALISGLTAALADVGTLQGMLTGVLARLGAIEELLPKEVRDTIHDALVGARDVVLDNLRDLSGALERSFFRETLEFLDVVPDTFSTKLPNAGRMLGFDDPRFGSSAQVAAVLSAFESERVRRATGPQELLTQVLSLRHILGGTGALQPLLQGLPLNFAITQEALDRVAPGLHRMLIKDVQVQIDFEVPQAEQLALASVLESALALAGGRADPALDGRVPGGGFPALPTVVGRLPTGIPALLTHRGVSRVRLKPSKALENAYVDACGDPIPPAWLPDPLRGTRLLPDTDPQANADGWRQLEFLDPDQSLLFSHFQILEDGVRFVHPNKELKTFEHRGVVASWTLEVPALVLKSVAHQLPPIRDIRLIVSTVAQYDRRLADFLPQPQVPVVEPVPTGGLLGTAPASIEQLLQTLNQSVQGVQTALGNLVTSFGQGVTSLIDVAQALVTRSVLLLGGAVTTPTAAGNVLRAVLLTTNSLPAATKTQVLAGAATGSWTVDPALLTASGVDPTKLVRVVQAVVSPILTAQLIGGTPPTFPAAAGQLGFQPTGGATTTAPITFTTGAVTVPASSLGSPTSPVGTWTLRLPTGMPSMTDAIVGVLLESRP